MQKILIVGCGDIGIQLAELLDESVQVYGLRRDVAALPPAIIGIAADVTEPASLTSLSDYSFDAVVISLSPGESSDQRYQQVYVQGSANVLAALNPQPLRRVIFVSSTSVYEQSNDEWVDETSVTLPTAFSGRRLLEAERLCSAYCQQHGIHYCSVRFAGIYGPGRLRLIKDVQAGKASAAHYSNRIHRDDCAGILRHLLNLAEVQLQTCYVGVDDMPVKLTEVKAWLAEQLGMQSPAIILNGARGGKRCSNQRIKESGYQLIYRNYQQGYCSLLQQHGYTQCRMK